MHAAQLFSCAENIAAERGVSDVNALLKRWLCWHPVGSQIQIQIHDDDDDDDAAGTPSDNINLNSGDWNEESINLTSDFIHLSDQAVVLLHFDFFSDLKCVFEWALICARKPFEKIDIGWDVWLGNNLPLIVKSNHKFTKK